MTLEVYFCAVDVLSLCQSVSANALYTPALRLRPSFHRDLTFLCVPARGNVIGALGGAPRRMASVCLRIDGTEAVPYKPPQLSDIPARTAAMRLGRRYCLRVSSGVDPGISLALSER